MDVVCELCGDSTRRAPHQRFWARQLQRMLVGMQRYQWVRDRFQTSYLSPLETFSGVANCVLVFPLDGVLLVYPQVVQDDVLQLPLDGDLHMCAHDFVFRYTLLRRQWTGARVMVSTLRVGELCTASGDTLESLVLSSPADE